MGNDIKIVARPVRIAQYEPGRTAPMGADVDLTEEPH
jgi:hypothetical protein